jgi:hypothetical protein
MISLRARTTISLRAGAAIPLGAGAAIPLGAGAAIPLRAGAAVAAVSLRALPLSLRAALVATMIPAIALRACTLGTSIITTTVPTATLLVGILAIPWPLACRLHEIGLVKLQEDDVVTAKDQVAELLLVLLHAFLFVIQGQLVLLFLRDFHRGNFILIVDDLVEVFLFFKQDVLCLNIFQVHVEVLVKANELAQKTHVSLDLERYRPTEIQIH